MIAPATWDTRHKRHLNKFDSSDRLQWPARTPSTYSAQPSPLWRHARLPTRRLARAIAPHSTPAHDTRNTVSAPKLCKRAGRARRAIEAQACGLHGDAQMHGLEGSTWVQGRALPHLGPNGASLATSSWEMVVEDGQRNLPTQHTCHNKYMNEVYQYSARVYR